MSDTLKMPAEEFSLNGDRPKIVRIKKSIVFLIISVFLAILFAAFYYGLQDHRTMKGQQEWEDPPLTATNNERLLELPNSYGGLGLAKPPEAPKLENPVPGDVGVLEVNMRKQLERQVSDLKQKNQNLKQTAFIDRAGEKAAQEERLRLLKAEAAARTSALFFKEKRKGSIGIGNSNSTDPISGLLKGFGGGGQFPSDNKTISQAGSNPKTGNNQTSGEYGEAAQNGQSEKRSWLDQAGNSNQFLLSGDLTSTVSPYEVLGGTIIPASLITGINSDLPGQIIAQVRENVFDTVSGRFLLIPQGSRLIGIYDSIIAYGQERVLVAWNRLILPNGKSISLEGMPGVDLSGYAGVSDKVNNHWGRIITGVVLSSLLSITASQSAGDSVDYQKDVSQEFASNAGDDINSTGQRIVKKQLNIQPTLEIRPGFSLNIFVNKDMILEPYQG